MSRVITERFSAEATLRHPWEALRETVAGFWKGRYLALRLTIREIKAEYVNLHFGFLWNFTEPVIYAVVFAILRKGQAFHAGNIDVPFGTYVLTGMVAYQIFVHSINKPLHVLTEYRSLVVQVKIPPEALVLATFYRQVFDATFFCVVVIATCLLTGVFHFWPTVVFVLCLPLLILLGLGIGFFLCPFSHVISDIGRATGSVLRILMFVSPIFFVIPDEGWLGIVNQVNPLAAFMVAARDILFFGAVPALHFFILYLVLTPVLFIVSCVVFHVSVPVVTDRV